MQTDPEDKQCVQVGISVFPTRPTPPPPPPPSIPAKLLALLKKYKKCGWRIKELAKPKPPIIPKFVPEVVKPRYDKKKEIDLIDETAYYSDQMSRPLLRTLVINKDLWGKQNGGKYRRRMRKRINKTWASIYNYYKLKERQKKRRQERLSKPDGKKKKPPPKVFKRTESLAMPKKVFLPETKGKKKKIFSDYKHLEVMAAPVSRPEPKPKRVGVNPAALTCTPSEITMRLAQVPERWLRVPKPLMPGKVKRGALKYKITPKIEALAVPKPRSEKAKTEDDAGPWTISKSALKYKATPRIIELAKPIERD